MSDIEIESLLSDRSSLDELEDHLLDLDPESTTTTTTLKSLQEKTFVKESWNNPRRNIFKVWTICFGFIVFGMNDASIGAIIHHLEDHYQINDAVVSLAFFFSFTGYLIAALCAESLHQRWGRRGVSCVGILAQAVCYLIASTTPAYPLFILGYSISGFGNGVIEASWNAYAGNLNNENEILGLLHGSYGLGGMISPAIETIMISHGFHWSTFYYVIMAAALVSFVNSIFAFKEETAQHYKDFLALHHELEKSEYELEPANGSYQQLDSAEAFGLSNTRPETSVASQVFRSKLIWLFSSVLFFYVGAEVTMGGWITIFMIKIRHGNSESMGYVTTGFWGGITLGRLVLGFLGGQIRREEKMTLIYMCLSVVFFVLFWWIPVMYVSAIMAGLVGFFMGPLYPTVMIVFMKKIPKKLQVFGIGFSAALGGVGAAIMPFFNGLLSAHFGPQSLGPFDCTLLSLMLLTWLVIVKFY